mgnify:CR=1 FL=1
MRVNNSLSEEGLRVLAFGYRELDCVRELSLGDEQGYVFIGLISMIDPPRPESVAAVADAKRAGIRTVMITGDIRSLPLPLPSASASSAKATWLYPAPSWSR